KVRQGEGIEQGFPSLPVFAETKTRAAWPTALEESSRIPRVADTQESRLMDCIIPSSSISVVIAGIGATAVGSRPSARQGDAVLPGCAASVVDALGQVRQAVVDDEAVSRIGVCPNADGFSAGRKRQIADAVVLDSAPRRVGIDARREHRERVEDVVVED